MCIYNTIQYMYIRIFTYIPIFAIFAGVAVVDAQFDPRIVRQPVSLEITEAHKIKAKKRIAKIRNEK